jgi:hypothetical protein
VAPAAFTALPGPDALSFTESEGSGPQAFESGSIRSDHVGIDRFGCRNQPCIVLAEAACCTTLKQSAAPGLSQGAGPDGNVSRPITRVMPNANAPMSANLGFASAIAEFGMLLRDSEHKGTASYGALMARARSFRGTDPEGYRAEFIKLADLAAALHAPR